MAAVFAVFAVASAAAQGPPASVNSLAPGRSFAPPASVNSLGPNGFSNLPVLLGNPTFPTGGFHIGGRHRRHPGFGGVGAVFVPYYVPVTPVYVVPDEVGDQRMVVDRRRVYEPVPAADGESRYLVRDLDERERPESMRSSSAPPSASPATAKPATPPAPEQASSFESQPETVLIFKDGHRLEITNYAIQGNTLFNLSGEGPRRIDTAELDVTATMKENDDRGLEFRLP
jgi:hypothetical protein